MKWNLRLAAANRGIWKASELQRLLAERGMVISAGKMSGLWSGQPNTVRLDELDVICAVLGCEVEELLLPEPETVPQPAPADGEQAAAVAEARAGHAPAARGQVAAAAVNCAALRDAAPRWQPPRPGLLQQQLQRAGLVLPAQERSRAAATLAAPGARRGRPGAAGRGGRPPSSSARPTAGTDRRSGCVLDGLTVVLDGRPAGERVTLTEIRTRTPRHASSPRVAEVLAGLGLLNDDTTPAVRAWIERRTGELPPGFAGAVRAWLLVLLDGDARARPRSHASIYVYFSAVQPLIEQLVGRPRPPPRGHRRRRPRRAGRRCTATSCAPRSPRCGRCSGSPRNAA